MGSSAYTQEISSLREIQLLSTTRSSRVNIKLRIFYVYMKVRSDSVFKTTKFAFFGIMKLKTLKIFINEISTKVFCTM